MKQISRIFINLIYFIGSLITNLLIVKMRNSIADRFQKQVNKCDICLSQYNRREKQPVIICSMHHTVCRECMTALEASQKCPFCRQMIRFDKVVLLPNGNSQPQPQPNTRVSVNPMQSYQSYQPGQPYQSYQPGQPYQPGQSYQPYQPPLQVPSPVSGQQQYLPSINAQPQQPVYNQYNMPPPNQVDDLGFDPAIVINEQIQYHDEQPLNCDNLRGSLMAKLRLDVQPARLFFYVAIFVLQLPFLFFDLYLSYTEPQSECMDMPHQSSAYVLRPWLKAMGYCEASFMVILFIGAALRICQIIKYDILVIIEWIVGTLLVLKMGLWIYIQLELFAVDISPYCSGGVYTYGLIQTILHCICLLIMCCVSLCSR